MSIMDLVNVNYKQIFNNLMQSQDAQSLMADFMNHCLLHCDETRECIINILYQNESFTNLVDESIERIIKKNKMKSDYFTKECE